MDFIMIVSGKVSAKEARCSEVHPKWRFFAGILLRTPLSKNALFQLRFSGSVRPSVWLSKINKLQYIKANQTDDKHLRSSQCVCSWRANISVQPTSLIWLLMLSYARGAETTESQKERDVFIAQSLHQNEINTRQLYSAVLTFDIG